MMISSVVGVFVILGAVTMWRMILMLSAPGSMFNPIDAATMESRMKAAMNQGGHGAFPPTVNGRTGGRIVIPQSTDDAKKIEQTILEGVSNGHGAGTGFPVVKDGAKRGQPVVTSEDEARNRAQASKVEAEIEKAIRESASKQQGKSPAPQTDGDATR
jgi:hypothetical protein